MATLTLTLPEKKLEAVRRSAKAEGFRTSTRWVRALIDEAVQEHEENDDDEGEVTAEMVLRWSREAKELKRAGKLPVLWSLSDLDP